MHVYTGHLDPVSNTVVHGDKRLISSDSSSVKYAFYFGTRPDKRVEVSRGGHAAGWAIACSFAPCAAVAE